MKKKNNKAKGAVKKAETFEHLHKKPVTRRDFLAAGLIPFSASFTFPSIFNMLGGLSIAQAQDLDCVRGAANGLCSLITLNLAGGAAMAANFVPHDEGLQPLPSYNKMGLGNGAVPIEREFGRVPFAGGNISRFLVGLRAEASTLALANSAFLGVCVQSRDDTSENRMDLTGMAAKAGLAGAILPNLGRRSGDTGNNNRFALVKPPAPLIVTSANSLRDSLGVNGTRLRELSRGQQEGLFKLVQNLSASQVRSIANASGGATLSQLVKCATNDNTIIVGSDDPGVDPTSNPQVSEIWGIDANTNPRDRDAIFATMVYNALNGNAGSANLEIGGYDYHNGTRTSGDQKDEEAGEVVGRILETAHVMGRKLFLVVTSDGSVFSPPSDDRSAPWLGDRGEAGCSYVIAYDPSGRPETSSFQVGHFNHGQAAERTDLGNPELGAAAIFANYLSFNKKVGLLEQVIPRALSTSQVSKLVKIYG